MAINPQIKLSLDPYAKIFEQITNLDLQIKDKFGRNYLPEIIKSSVNSHFLIIENMASDIDMIQFNGLCSALHAEGHYGLTQLAPNILSWVYEAALGDRTPHNAQEYPPLFGAIDFLISHFDAAVEYSDIYFVLSELWNDHFNLVRENLRS